MFKYNMVSRHIEALLEKGAFRRQPPITINDLAAELGVNPRTVTKGLEPFIENQVLRTVKSRGIVQVGTGQPWTVAGVGLIMPISDHYYGPLASAIAATLNERQIAPLFIDARAIERSTSPRAILQPYLNRHLRAFVIDGVGYFEQPALLETLREYRLIFVHVYDAPGALPPAAVLVDFEAGAALAVRHLIELGHRRIGLAIFGQDQSVYIDETHRRRSRYGQFVDGCSRALTEAGLDPELPVFWFHRKDGIDPSARWQEMMSSPNRPTAFVCSSDYCASDIMNRAIAMGLRVPEDLALVGCYNTPWAELSPVKLTSLDLKIDQQARLVAEEIAAAEGKSSVHQVMPRLIVRESTTCLDD